MSLSSSYVRNVSDKNCRENQNTFCVRQIISEIRAVCEIMWKNMVQLDRPQMKTIRRMRFACWVTKATDTHSENGRRVAFHCNNGYSNSPLCYVVRAVSASCIIFIAQFLEPNKCSVPIMDSDLRNRFISASYLRI